MSPRLLAAGAVLALLALAAGGWALRGGLGGARSAASAAASAASGPAPVVLRRDEWMHPRRQALELPVTMSGSLTAPDTVTVRSKAGGVLERLTVAEGDVVRAGQPVGLVVQTELDSRIAEREAAVAQAQAQAAQSERVWKQNQQLAERGFISAAALEQSRSQWQAAQAATAAAQASARTVRSAQADSRLVSPITGVVAKRSALAGERLAPEQPVLQIVNLRRLELNAQVGVDQVGLLRPGLPVTVRVEGVPAEQPGTIDRIAPVAEPGSRAIAVVVAVPNGSERLRGGQYATATARVGDPTLRLLVPKSAVQTALGERFVWALEPDDRLRRRVVTLGRESADGVWVEVLSGGLDEGSRVLGARFDGLREGAPVRWAPQAALAAGGSAAAPAQTASAAASAASR